ncbi:hypothetical protein AB9F26_17220 [Falsihalocynthiibacter sp. BN13B15]|uniref:hypothetical protein n=1 Tax=Falsihalocynthiibacter sp. BN13B15 TaxID=3240871 RepID=UPI00350F938F
MADNNDTQAQALVAALAPQLAAAIIPQLTEQVETQIKGVVSKNDELLDKIASMKNDVEIAQSGKAHDELMASTKRLLEAADGDMKSRLAPDGTFNSRKAGDSIKIKRSDALDVRAYREAKSLAEKEGVPLEIVADQ